MQGFFIVDTLKTTLLDGKFNPKIRVFLSKIRTFFLFSKGAGEASPLPTSCAPVKVAEYASVCLNMPKHP